MDTENTNDDKAMPPASAGSHPFWAWWSHDLGIGHFADIKSRAIAYRDAGCGEIFPIYRQPQPALTQDERWAIAAAVADARGQAYRAGRFVSSEVAATFEKQARLLLGLAERLK